MAWVRCCSSNNEGGVYRITIRTNATGGHSSSAGTPPTVSTSFDTVYDYNTETDTLTLVSGGSGSNYATDSAANRQIFVSANTTIVSIVKL